MLLICEMLGNILKAIKDQTGTIVEAVMSQQKFDKKDGDDTNDKGSASKTVG